jgi:tripartite-type tricarboxylate transporter receptor subunit TctC
MQRISRRSALVMALAAPATGLLPSLGQAETYPDKLIKVVIPFAAGGPNDVIGRPLFEKMAEQLGQSFIIENRPGAQGRTATQAVAKSPPDGYTLLMTTGSHVANLALYQNLPYDPLADFIGVTQIAESYGLAMVVRKDLPGKDIKEFIEIAKANPGKFTFGHPGIGNANHIGGELFQKLCGVQLVGVAYRGSGSYVQDVISGQIDMAWASTALVTGNVKNGLLRALATTGDQRAPTLPDAPTMMEIGYKDFNWNGYFGIYAPAGTPPDRIAKLNDAAVKAIKTPQLQRVLEDSGLKTVASTPAEFKKYLENDLEHQRRVVKLINLQPPQ